LGAAAISYDAPEILDAFSRRYAITFPLLSDPGSATIRTYGILNTVADEAPDTIREDATVAADFRKHVTVTSSGAAGVIRGTPFPGTFMLDARGRVTARFFEDFYRERSTASSIMIRAGASADPTAATRISTDHLDLTTYTSDPIVAPGNRIALVVGVTPKRKMHVYAPGASGYRVVSLRIDPQPFVRVLSLQYPASEIYVFAPLNERVPVYQKEFTLIQDLVLEATPEAERALERQKVLTLKGSLEYQACDDKVCFNPTSIPLSWTLTITPNITERVGRPR
jgi:peroxiredoxin